MNKNRENTAERFNTYASKGRARYSSNPAAAKSNLNLRMKQVYPTRPNRGVSKPILLLGIAASLALAVGIFSLWSTEYKYQYSLSEALPTSVIERSQAPAVDGEPLAHLNQAITHYEKNEFGPASLFFKHYLKHGLRQRQSEASLLLGHSLANDNPAEAIGFLENYINSGNVLSNHQDFARWYLAWSYLQEGYKEQGKAILQELIIESNITSLKADARNLLRTLK